MHGDTAASARARSRRSVSRALRSLHGGFTLAEILVVLIVLGIAAGVAYARYDSDPKTALEHESARLAGALEHAAQLAQWRSRAIAFAPDDRGYRFLAQNANGEWTSITDDDVLRARALPPTMVAIPRSYSDQPLAADAVIPFRASGKNDPYAIELVLGEWSIMLAADPLNRVHAIDAPTR